MVHPAGQDAVPAQAEVGTEDLVSVTFDPAQDGYADVCFEIPQAQGVICRCSNGARNVLIYFLLTFAAWRRGECGDWKGVSSAR